MSPQCIYFRPSGSLKRNCTAPVHSEGNCQMLFSQNVFLISSNGNPYHCHAFQEMVTGAVISVHQRHLHTWSSISRAQTSVYDTCRSEIPAYITLSTSTRAVGTRRSSPCMIVGTSIGSATTVSALALTFSKCWISLDVCSEQYIVPCCQFSEIPP